MRGFTLMEMLIVVGVIAILAVILVVIVRDPQAKARDAKRMQDVSQIANALRFYYNEYETFPQNPIFGQTCYYNKDFSESDFYSVDCLGELEESGIMPVLPDAPHTPSADNIRYGYGYYAYDAPSENVIGHGAVIGTTLETRTEPSSCQFTAGTWCDEKQNPQRYCICLYY